jgi:hypothetical protein
MKTARLKTASKTLRDLAIEVSAEEARILGAAVAILESRIAAAQADPMTKREAPPEATRTPACAKCGGRTAEQDPYLSGIMESAPEIFCVSGCDDRSAP